MPNEFGWNLLVLGPWNLEFSFGGSGGDRTHDHQLKRLLLYRLSYRPIIILVYYILNLGFFQVPTATQYYTKSSNR